MKRLFSTQPISDHKRRVRRIERRYNFRTHIDSTYPSKNVDPLFCSLSLSRSLSLSFYNSREANCYISLFKKTAFRDPRLDLLPSILIVSLYVCEVALPSTYKYSTHKVTYSHSWGLSNECIKKYAYDMHMNFSYTNTHKNA